MNDPYVATNRGYRRKIGPGSKYRMNDRPQGGDGSRFTGSRLDAPRYAAESRFSVSLREAREVSEANAAMERREKQRTNQAKQAEAEKKSAGSTSQANSVATRAVAGAMGGASGAMGAAVGNSASKSPTMSREERNKIEDERRAKGRAKAEAERPGSLKAKMEAARTGPKPLPTYDPKAPKMSSQPPDPLRREESKPDFMKRMVAESNARQASKSTSTGKEPKVSYASPAPSGSNFGAARSRAVQAAASEKKQAAAPAAKKDTPAKPSGPSWMARKIAANPDGIFGKAADVAGKAERGVMNTAKSVAPIGARVGMTAFNKLLAEPATFLRRAIDARAKKAPQGAIARVAKKLPYVPKS